MFHAAKIAMAVAFGLALTACAAQVPGSETNDESAAQQQELARSGRQLCRPRQCGPELGLPNVLCSDGVTVGGPTGRCLRQPDGSCGWEVISCPPDACASSASCAAGQYCTVEDGDCNPAPGCVPGGVCTDVCYGVCKPKPVDPCAGKVCGDPCVGPFASPLPTYCDQSGQCQPLAEKPVCKGPCGGIAGIPCPGFGQCVDDPSDSCDPANGGADCGGLCTCVQRVLCAIGSHFDSDPTVCACVPDAARALSPSRASRARS
jgi:hypothetical protein